MKILLILLIAGPVYALDMSQMTAVECAPTDLNISYRNGTQLSADIKTSCNDGKGTGKFCFTDATCLYVDNKVLEKKYHNSFDEARRGEADTLRNNVSNIVKTVFSERSRKNPDSLRSFVNIACYTENNNPCPPLLTCLKNENVVGGTMTNQDAPTFRSVDTNSNLNPNKPTGFTK